MSFRYLIDAIISSAFQQIINCLLAPAWFNNLNIGEIEPYVIFYRFIYPKWLSLKRKNYYYVRIFKQYRHIKQQRTRLDIGVMIHN